MDSVQSTSDFGVFGVVQHRAYPDCFVSFSEMNQSNASYVLIREGFLSICNFCFFLKDMF